MGIGILKVGIGILKVGILNIANRCKKNKIKDEWSALDTNMFVVKKMISVTIVLCCHNLPIRKPVPFCTGRLMIFHFHFTLFHFFQGFGLNGSYVNYSAIDGPPPVVSEICFFCYPNSLIDLTN